MNDTLPTDEDAGALLIARIVDRAAQPSDYDRFDALVQAAPGRWSELLSALRDDDALHAALDDDLRAADSVELPAVSPVVRTSRLRLLGPWTGWLAAAALAVVWLTGSAGTEGAGAPDLTAQLVASPDGDGSGPRLRNGPPAADPVLAELPLQLVGTQRAADGAGVDFLYVQPVLRRGRIDGVLQVGTDEHGRPTPVPADPAVLVRHESL